MRRWQETAVSDGRFAFLKGMVGQTVVFFTHAADEKTIAIIHDLADNLPPIQADADRLRQVLHNLLANALRHTPPDGKITIRTWKTAVDIHLSITDTGEDISPELQSHLFDRFYRAERRDSGSAGLGLAISKAIVEAHNGRITISSSGKGSTISIDLPFITV